MSNIPRNFRRNNITCCCFSWLSLLAQAPAFSAVNTEPALGKTLHAQYDTLQTQLQNNLFGQPMVMQSAQGDHGLQGEVYAVIDFPFAQVSAELSSPAHWCEIIILHINTKHCSAVQSPQGPVLQVHIGKKTREALAQTSRVDFSYKIQAANPEWLAIALHAANGPMGTSNYRIVLEAIPLSHSKAFVHLTYSYAVGLTGRLALQTYLTTTGRAKVGFTVLGKPGNGPPQYIDGVRGLVERNTMRYYLAIVAYLESTQTAPEMQLEKRLRNWFTAVERYPVQLHEMNWQEYVDMKHAETLPP